MKVLMTGNEAVARGLYEAGVSFASAYPGTPSIEILENVDFESYGNQRLLMVQLILFYLYLQIFLLLFLLLYLLMKNYIL